MLPNSLAFASCQTSSECPSPFTGWYCDYLLSATFADEYMKDVKGCVDEHGFPPYNLTINGTADCNLPYTAWNYYWPET
jgi:hypothetical protein